MTPQASSFREVGGEEDRIGEWKMERGIFHVVKSGERLVEAEVVSAG